MNLDHDSRIQRFDTAHMTACHWTWSGACEYCLFGQTCCIMLAAVPSLCLFLILSRCVHIFISCAIV